MTLPMPLAKQMVLHALAAFLGVLLIAGELRSQVQPDEAARRAASTTIRAGDRIELQFRRDRELNSSVNVNERGEAVFPKLGILSVSDITIAALPDTLRLKYSQFLRHPELEVTVLRRVVVNGEVRAANVFMLDIASSGVRDAIARAGGLLETSDRKKVFIVRDGRRIHARNWETSTGPEMDLHSGDQVLVGRKNWLTLNALPVISTSVIVIGLIRSLRSN